MQLTSPDASWLADEITDGLQRLSALCLQRAPHPDVLPITNRVWFSAVAPHTTWERERDIPRIRAAFRRLIETRTTWPAPRDLLEALPERPQPKALPPPPPVLTEQARLQIRLLRARMALFTRTRVVTS